MDQTKPPPMARPRVAAGALFFDERGYLLLVKPTYKEGWDIPGGYVEPGETPIEACQREIEEELGLTRRVDQLLVVDWAPSEREGDKILFVFMGGNLDDRELRAVELPSEELGMWAFQPLESFDDLMPDRLSRRLAAAVEAHRNSEVLYLEHGSRLSSQD